ncbi:hypothetical protein SUDANB58_02574 [Streptomyces sp. enrichment culture]|uniref:hypothetical protein n=1 Tax=Streptomyces sp. enrichment culture TaxID=1795815 RepID=UPI003F56C40F
MTLSGPAALVAKLRNALAQHREQFELWTPEIPAGVDPAKITEDIPASVAAMLTMCDGLYMDHSTQLYSRDDLPYRQISENLVGAVLPDGAKLTDASHFFCFGQAAGNPLLVDSHDGSVWRVPDDGVVWYTGCRLEKIAADVGEFFTNWITSPRFQDLAGLPSAELETSDWYRLLRLSGLTT